MKTHYLAIHQRCKACQHKFDCLLSPSYRYNPARIKFVFFPELVVESSFAELFPELTFYP